MTEEQQQQHQGEIQLIIGPMFSGKSSEMTKRIRRFYYAKKKTIIIKYVKDDRYSKNDEIFTHDKIKSSAFPAAKLADVYEKCLNYDVIGIDEGQFYPDLLEYAELFANVGKIVIIAALDGDYKREPFLDVCKLVPKCESVIKLRAVCMECGKKASFSFRITNEKETEVIGGSDKYVALCRKCYAKKEKKNV